MSDLEALKRKHPEWCWKCEEMRAHRQPCAFRPHPVIAALTAAKLEDEETIRELEGCLIAEQEHAAQAEAELSAEQAAHAATREALEYLVDQIRKGSPVDDHGHPLLNNMAYIKAVELLVCAADPAKEELRKADEALVHNWEAHPELSFKDYAERDAAFESYQTALARQAQRAADCGREIRHRPVSPMTELGQWCGYYCPATPEEHRLCARVAELEAKLAEAKARIEAQDKLISAAHLDGLREFLEWGLEVIKSRDALKEQLRSHEASNG